MKDDYQRVPIYDRRGGRKKRAMDLIIKDGRPAALEMKGQGYWTIEFEDAQEQINEALKEQASGTLKEHNTEE